MNLESIPANGVEKQGVLVWYGLGEKGIGDEAEQQRSERDSVHSATSDGVLHTRGA